VIIPRQGKLKRRAPRPAADADIEDDADEEVHEVYVYVDDQGVEHELSAEEAAQYEVVHEVEHVVEEPEPDLEPQSAAAADEAGEPTTYFWVDENGVEHEVTEDELHEFELYDEDES